MIGGVDVVSNRFRFRRVPAAVKVRCKDYPAEVEVEDNLKPIGRCVHQFMLNLVLPKWIAFRRRSV